MFEKALFNEMYLGDWCLGQKRQAVRRVERLDAAFLADSSDQEILDMVISQYGVEPLTLDVENASQQIEDSAPIVGRGYGTLTPRRGHHVRVSIPFSGATQLWTLTPSGHKSVHPSATVVPDGNIIVVEFVFEKGSVPENLNERLHNKLDEIQWYLDVQAKDLTRFHSELGREIENAISARRDTLKEQDGIADMLGLPLNRRRGEPDFERVPLERRIKPIPPPPSTGYKKEPMLTPEQFEGILALVRHQGRTLEQVPDSVAALGEVMLRDLILAALNTLYEGQATGETFRKRGKTDIRIEAADRSAFVGECKLWEGAKRLGQGVDQLLSYLTWRDCKAAVVVFNKEVADRKKVLREVTSLVEGHPSFKSHGPTQDEGEFRFVLRSTADESREVHCHFFVFHMPQRTKKRARKGSKKGGAKPS